MNCLTLRQVRLSLVLAGLVVAVVPASGQWSEPVNVSRVPFGLALYQSLAIDSRGTLHAAWSLRVGSPDSAYWVQYSRKEPDADTWALPVKVNRDSTGSWLAQVVVGPNDVPFILWQDDARPGICYSLRCDDTWSVPDRIPNWSGYGGWLRATSDLRGTIHAVWEQTNYRCIWHTSCQDSTWSVPDTVVSDTGLYAVGRPDIAIDRQGFAHVVYLTTYEDTVGYVRQTQDGWTPPERLPVRGAPARAAIGSLGLPQVVIRAHNHPAYCHRTDDTWSQPVELDSLLGYWPSICCDSWNRVHAFIANDEYGMMERVNEHGEWGPAVRIDSPPGVGEPAVGAGRLHLLVIRSAPFGPDVWYYSRALDPPGVAEGGIEAEHPPTQVAPMPTTLRTGVEFSLSGREDVSIEIIDTAGRVVKTVRLGILQKGRHAFRPYRCLPGPGVYVCRIKTGKNVRAVKLIRVD